MGMSGNWEVTQKDHEPKHMHLMFDSMDNTILGLVDTRRFAKWRWGDWNYGRGPDPIMDHDNFLNNIWNNIEDKAFEKPICEILMNQAYFNGLGNYLRAEVLFRANQNPFQIAKDAINDNPAILELCKIIPIEAYQMGGGQLKDWDNPFELEADTFNEWIKCYGRKDMLSVVDKTGRKLWFDSKWKSNCIYDF
mgnify:FL=1